ncbi:hypothetical protein CU665_20105 [Pseudomonas syringae pv. actinidifoliorum]|nr:hypothetical protein [Pseudomonas syringae pv. actinidifoliorum]
MPTRSVGTIVFLRTPIVPQAPAWECISGRSASNLDQRCGEVCDAERPERRANAERRHDNQPQKRARYRYLALLVLRLAVRASLWRSWLARRRGTTSAPADLRRRF